MILIELFVEILNFRLILTVKLGVILFVLFFVLEHLLVLVNMVDSLLLHDLLSVDLDSVTVVLVLILQMLDFLHVNLDGGSVTSFLLLHLGVQVLDSRL